MVQAQLLRLVLALLEQILSVLLDARVIRNAIPRNCQEQVEEVAVGFAQAERIAASGGCFGCDCRGQGLEAQAVCHLRYVERLHRAVRNIENPTHQLRAIAVRPRDEQLAAVGAGCAGEFEGEVREVGDAHSADGPGEVGEVFENGRVGDIFGGVLEVAGGEPKVAVGDVDVGVDQGGVGVVGGAAGEGFEGGELGVFGVDVVVDETSPGEHQG